MQRRNAVIVLLGDSRIVEAAGCLDDMKRSWLTPMVIELRCLASRMCSVWFVLFCFVQDKGGDLDTKI